MIILDTPDQIALYRLAALKSMLHLEANCGMKGKAYRAIKQEFQLKGNKKSVYAQYCVIFEKLEKELLAAQNKS